VLKRVAGGGSLFMTEYQVIGVPGGISFATKLPGHMVPIEVGPGNEYMIDRHGFLCATPQIQISVGFQQSLGAGIFWRRRIPAPARQRNGDCMDRAFG